MIQAFHYMVTCTNRICFPSSVWTEEYDTVFNNSCTYQMTTWGGMRPFWWPVRRPINVSDKVSNQWNMKLLMLYIGLAALPKRLSSTKAMPWMYWPITQNQYVVKKKKSNPVAQIQNLMRSDDKTSFGYCNCLPSCVNYISTVNNQSSCFFWALFKRRAIWYFGHGRGPWV